MYEATQRNPESQKMIDPSMAAEPEAKSFPVATDGIFEDCERICSVHDACILIVEQADGWRSGWSASLPDYTISDEITVHQIPYTTRGEAITAACERLIDWCGQQKDQGSKKHRKLAASVQDWALEVERRESPNPDEVLVREPKRELALQTSAIPEGELLTIPLQDLHESPWNPRQYYPEAEMAELVSSMQASGYREWLPLMVRPRSEGGYEIGAGHRRRRAAELAGIAAVPCVVRPMTDAEFLDVLNFDNCGRKDVHPLHEAAGWRAWMEKTGKGVLDIAARIGQSKEYVYQRLKYADLIPEAKEKFLDEEISPGHAILIARLQEPEQKKALKFCCVLNDWEREHGRKKSVRDLARFIQQDVHLEMREACFDLNSAELVPSAGTCTACPKRTANSPELILDPDRVTEGRAQGLEEIEGTDDCTDPACFHAKVNAHLVMIKGSLAANGEEVIELSTAYRKGKKNGPLSHDQWSQVDGPGKGVKTAIIADGYEVGKVVHVKIKTDSGKSAADEKANRDRAEEERKANGARERAIRNQILAAIRPKIAGLTRADLEGLIAMAVERDDADELCAWHGIKHDQYGSAEALTAALPKLAESDLHQLVVESTVVEEFDDWHLNRPASRLLALAKRYKVDAARIRNEMEKQAKEAEGGTVREVVKKLPVLNAKPAKPAKKKASAKPKPAPKLDPSTRKRIAEAQKKRWAEHKRQKAGKK